MKDKVANIYKQKKMDGKYLMFIRSWRKYTFKKKLSVQSFHFSLYYQLDSETFKIISLPSLEL